MRSWFSGCVTFSVLAIILIVSAGAQQPMAKEYQIKAVFLFNFTQFVEWPADAFERSDSPFVIGILGEDPFGAFLDETVKSEAIQDHPLTVERYASVNDIGNCHILFVSPKTRQEVREALDGLATKPVLTVSDVEGFSRIGGMIHFINEGGHIRLRINVDPVNDARLTVSSKLLRLAEIVPSTKSN